MCVLLTVLVLVRRGYPQHDIGLWIRGLMLILLECIARLAYEAPLPALWHRLMHSLALVAYVLAGTMFLRSSQTAAARRLPRDRTFTLLNEAPAVLLCSLYGAGVTSGLVYTALTLTGLLTAFCSCVLMRRRRAQLAMLLAIWLPGTAAALNESPRLVVYLILGALYLVTAISFAFCIARGSRGKIAVVTGFALWGACFVTHPWVATLGKQWIALAGEIWNMQKFLIVVGFLVVLFEKEVGSNEWMALHDQLTGLPNRRLFNDRLTSSLARAERDGTAMVLFCMDLNHFKEVNDTLGHDAGDALLRSVADRLDRVVRRTDTLARHGGDEFVLLATDMKSVDSGRCAEGRPSSKARAGQAVVNGLQDSILQHVQRIEHAIRYAIRDPAVVPGADGPHSVPVSISIGSAVYPTDATDLAELTRIADQRMYDDKRRQRAERPILDGVLELIAAD